MELYESRASAWTRPWRERSGSMVYDETSNQGWPENYDVSQDIAIEERMVVIHDTAEMLLEADYMYTTLLRGDGTETIAAVADQFGAVMGEILRDYHLILMTRLCENGKGCISLSEGCAFVNRNWAPLQRRFGVEETARSQFNKTMKRMRIYVRKCRQARNKRVAHSDAESYLGRQHPIWLSVTAEEHQAFLADVPSAVELLGQCVGLEGSRPEETRVTGDVRTVVDALRMHPTYRQLRLQLTTS